MNPVPGRVSSQRRWCSFLLCKKRAHRGDWAKTTHSNLSCGGGASTCRNGQARRRHLTKRSFISKVELMATPRALSRITTTGSALLQLQTDPHRKEGECAFMLCTIHLPRSGGATSPGQMQRTVTRSFGLLVWPEVSSPDIADSASPPRFHPRYCLARKPRKSPSTLSAFAMFFRYLRAGR